jgi:hypothetical protein
LVSTTSGQRFCSENGGMLFIETSAKENTNVDQAFILLAEKALKRQEMMSKQAEES